jgi:hypothetical protein
VLKVVNTLSLPLTNGVFNVEGPGIQRMMGIKLKSVWLTCMLSFNTFFSGNDKAIGTGQRYVIRCTIDFVVVAILLPRQ